MESTDSFARVITRMGESWRLLTPWQRLLLGGGAVVVAGTLWVFVALLSRPKMMTLYSGLRPAEAQTLGARLSAKNMVYELSPDGASLLVPADKLDISRLETASQGLPRNARLGFELFDTPNWAGSDFTEKVNYQRALEGELERTLQTLGEVEAVRVHLVMPTESIFSERERSAKAAVIVKTRGRQLSEDGQMAIPQLVASAVDRLKPEDVTVVDADSNTPILRAHAGSSGYELDETLAKTLVNTLEPVVGKDRVRASVHVEYDLSSSEDTQESYDPRSPVAVSLQRSEENLGGSAPGGIPGTASNVPGSASGAASMVAAEAERQSSRSESSTYAVSKTVRHTTQPPGRVRRMTAAVLVDDAIEPAAGQAGSAATRKRSADEMKEIERLSRAAIGIDEPRGDLLAIENLSFQRTPSEKISAPTPLQQGTRFVQQWSGLLRYVAISVLFLIVYGLLFRPMKKQALAVLRALPSKLAQSGHSLAAEANAGGGQAIVGEVSAVTDPARRTAELKRQLAEKVKNEPGAASRLVQGWIREASVK